MSEEKKTAVTEEVKEEVRKLTEEELSQVTGGGWVLSGPMSSGPMLGVTVNADGIVKVSGTID